MTTALLTAIVPIHKMSGKLGPLIKWSQEAVGQNIQLVLIHDFADLETELELVEFANLLGSDQVKFISGQFGGPGAARNQGFTQITTPYFCFWDSDDEPDVSKFVSMAEAAQKAGAEVAVGNFKSQLGDKSAGVVLKRSNQNFTDLVAFNPGIWRMCFQTGVIGGYRFENLKWAEDQLFLSDIKFADRHILKFDETVYTYNTDSTSSLTSNRNNASELLLSIRKLIHVLKSQISEKNFSFVSILILRQSLTLMKKGNLKLKWKGLQHLLELITFLRIMGSINLFQKLLNSRK
jgi:glycosyltransferase involved in cell wall biosynthesis